MTTWFEGVWQDLRFAARLLRRAPAFTITAVLTLALGVGANTGIFSLINGFLRPLPVPQPDRIVVLASELPGDDTGVRFRFSYPALVDYRAQTQVFSDLFGYDTRIGGLTLDGKTTQFLYQFVTGNFFSGLGLAPAAGRLFEAGEGEQLGSEPVVVLGHSAWVKHFGASPAVLGTLVRIDGRAARVVGVAPKGFGGMAEGFDMDGYVPVGNLRLAREPARLFTDRTLLFLTLAGRLRAGVSLASAQDAVSTVARRLEGQYPATEKGTSVRVVSEPYARPIPARFFSSLLPVIKTLLFGLATMVLLLACLNVTNLLFVRATVRQRELAIRSALGSSRGQLVRLLLAESALLACLGTVTGLILGWWSTTLVAGSLNVAMDLPLVLDFHFDWRVFSYAFATAVFTGLVIGIVPAFRASRTDVTDVLHDGARGSSGARRQRLRSALVVAQVAGSLVLMVVAGLLVRNLQRAERINLGFEPDHLLTLRINTAVVGYDIERTSRFFDELQRRVRGLTGVERAALSFTVPMGYIFDTCPIEPEGLADRGDHSPPGVAYNSVGTDYFTTLRLPLLQGRAFDDRDTSSSIRVAVVNETLAARLWPGDTAIGKRLKVLCAAPGMPWEVVGVAHNSKYIAVFEQPLPYLYLPLAQTQPLNRVVQLRSALLPEELSTRVQQEVNRLDPDVPVADVRTMNQVLSGGLGYILFRFGARQAAAMAALGLVLAVVGLYGVVSYSASQRVREIGIRLALGADPAGVRYLVLRQGAALAAGGIVVGLAASILVTAVLTRFLVLVSVSDPMAFVIVTAALVASAMVACYLPARRAMRVDPMTALRHE